MFSDDDRVREWLGHIIENADNALAYVEGRSFDEWRADQMRVDAVERCLMRLTEAAIRIGEDRIREIAPDVVMHEVRDMGNIIRREYDGLDAKKVWRTVAEVLPPLRDACRACGLFD